MSSCPAALTPGRIVVAQQIPEKQESDPMPVRDRQFAERKMPRKASVSVIKGKGVFLNSSLRIGLHRNIRIFPLFRFQIEIIQPVLNSIVLGGAALVNQQGKMPVA